MSTQLTAAEIAVLREKLNESPMSTHAVDALKAAIPALLASAEEAARLREEVATKDRHVNTLRLARDAALRTADRFDELAHERKETCDALRAALEQMTKWRDDARFALDHAHKELKEVRAALEKAEVDTQAAHEKVGALRLALLGCEGRAEKAERERDEARFSEDETLILRRAVSLALSVHRVAEIATSIHLNAAHYNAERSPDTQTALERLTKKLDARAIIPACREPVGAVNTVEFRGTDPEFGPVTNEELDGARDGRDPAATNNARKFTSAEVATVTALSEELHKTRTALAAAEALATHWATMTNAATVRAVAAEARIAAALEEYEARVFPDRTAKMVAERMAIRLRGEP